MRAHQEDTNAFNTFLKSGKWSHSHKVLTTDVMITLKGSIVNALDPNGADRIAYLPEREAGRFFVIGHIGAANIISVQTAQGVELLQLQTGETCILFAGDPEWIGVNSQMNLKVFGYTGPNHSEGLVPDPGPGPIDPNPDNRRFLSELGWQSISLLTAGDDYYKNHRAGGVTLAPLGAELLDFTSTNSILSILAVVGTTDAIQFTVNQSAIDHNALTNYVADQHVAHSGVTLTAGIGLAGGGNIAASRTFDLDLNDLTADTPVLADTFAFYDVSGSDTNKATLTVLNGILDHNALLNYSADRHVAHSTVSIVAGTGLSGGGDITTSRTLSLDINGLTADTIAAGDFFPFFDISGGDTNKITMTNLNSSFDLRALTNYVANEHINHSSVLINTTEGIQGGGDITASRTLKLDISNLTQDTTPDLANDWLVTFDTSAGTHKKVRPNAVGGAGGGTTVTISDTPPGSPSAGNLWWESDTGSLYIYYNDGTSSQWMQVTTGVAPKVLIQDTPPSGVGAGTLWWESDTATLYMYYNDGTSSQWVGVGGSAILTGREVLTAARNYYVRTDGSNSNNGLTNSAGGAFLTIQKAVDTLLALDCSIYGVTINVGAGTFNENVSLLRALGTTTMTIVGAGSTTIIQGGAGAAFATSDCGVWAIQSLKILSTSYHGILAAGTLTNLQLTNVEFGACGAPMIRSTTGANVRCFGGCSVSGNSPNFISTDNKGNFTMVSVTFTLTGTPAFAGAFIAAAGLCYVWVEAVTWSGSATGTRYTVTTNSVIYTGTGGSATYLPGNAAGSASSGGVYL